jgi:hypothetical protein
MVSPPTRIAALRAHNAYMSFPRHCKQSGSDCYPLSVLPPEMRTGRIPASFVLSNSSGIEIFNNASGEQGCMTPEPQLWESMSFTFESSSAALYGLGKNSNPSSASRYSSRSSSMIPVTIRTASP